MTALTGKQELFCKAFVDMKTGKRNASKAYAHSYDVSRMKPESINRKAFDVYHLPKIVKRLAELDEKTSVTLEYTREKHIKKLEEIRDLALADDAWTAAAATETNIGKALGMYTTKIEDVTTAEKKLANMTPEQLDAYIERLQKMKAVV